MSDCNLRMPHKYLRTVTTTLHWVLTNCIIHLHRWRISNCRHIHVIGDCLPEYRLSVLRCLWMRTQTISSLLLVNENTDFPFSAACTFFQFHKNAWSAFLLIEKCFALSREQRRECLNWPVNPSLCVASL